jgi:hypothetical protein
VDEALEKLNKYVEQKESLRWLGIEPTKRYEGYIKGFDFNFSRAVQRNLFYPVISGKIETETNGCSVSFSIYPNPLILAFMFQFLAPAGLLFLFTLVSFIGSILGINKDNSVSIEGVFASGVFFGLGHVFFVGLFKAEAGVTKDFFQELFKAKETVELDFLSLFKTG